MALKVGDSAPDFHLRDHHGADVVLSELRGKPVVLVFYPFAFSSVCTGELCEIRDEWASLPGAQSEDVAVFAISCDHMFSLRAFADFDNLQFPLLSDFWPHGQVSQAYGVFHAEGGFSQRSTYIIDAEGRIAWSVHNDVPAARDLNEYRRVLAELTK